MTDHEDNAKNLNNAAAPADDAATLVIKTAIRTAVTALAVVILLAAFLVTLLPYEAMLAYRDFGNKPRALECAENFIERERERYTDKAPELDSRYVSALYLASELSVSLYTNAESASEKAERAESVIKYTEEYLAVPAISERNAKINEHNLKYESARYHASLYSYRDYLVRYNYLARCTLSRRDSLLYDGKTTPVSDLSAIFYNENFTPSHTNIDSIAESLNMLSAMISYDFEKAGATGYVTMGENELGGVGASKLIAGTNWFSPLVERSGGNKTALLIGIERRFPALVDYSLGKILEENGGNLTQQLYLFRTLANFADNMDSMLTALAASELYTGIAASPDATYWRGINKVDYYADDGKVINYALRDYYNLILLPKYAKTLTSPATAA